MTPRKGADEPAPDVRLKPCEDCQSEGRIIRAVSRHWGLEPREEDCGECPVCEGTGMALVEVEPVEEEEIMDVR